MRILFQIGLAAAGAAFAAQGIAAPADGIPGAAQPPAGQFQPAQFQSAQFQSDTAVAPDSLDAYRGGFTDPSGLNVSLGIERIVTVNGNVAATSNINFGDLRSLTSGKTALSADAASQLNLIQNGNGALNVQFGPSVLGGTVIQNSLNNQLINNATIINASVDARGLLQAMNFQSTLSNALNTAATGR
jgi:hypothetical protein